MAAFIGQGKVQFFNNNGSFLSGGQVWVYDPDSTTPVNTYTDILSAINGTNPQPNPVPLNSRGEAIIVITQAVDLVVEDAPVNPFPGAHGNVIWTIPNFAVADVESDQVGTYHFLNNTIADSQNNPAFSFNAVANAINLVNINSGSGSNFPTIITTTSSGANDMDLGLSGQNAGVVRINKALKIYNATNSNVINLTLPTATASSSFLTVFGSTADLGIQAAGLGNINLLSNSTITGNLSISGNASITGTLTAGSFSQSTITSNTINNAGTITTSVLNSTTTNANSLSATSITSSGNITSTSTASIATLGTGSINSNTSISANTTIAAQGDISSLNTITSPVFRYKNGSFMATLQPATLSASPTITLPNYTCIMPAADGSSNDPLVTNGSGTWSFGSTGIAIKNGSFRATVSSGTLTGNTTLTLPNYSCTFPQSDGSTGDPLVTNGSGVFSFGTTSLPIKQGSFRNTINSGTLAGNVTTTLPNFSNTFPQADGLSGAVMITNGSGTFSFSAGSSYGVVSVYNASQTGITNNTNVKVQFTTEVYDPNNVWDSVTNFRYTPVLLGYYKFSICGLVGTSGSGVFGNLYIFKNGVQLGAGVPMLVSTTTQPFSGTFIGQVTSSSDYFEFYLNQNSGASATATNISLTVSPT